MPASKQDSDQNRIFLDAMTHQQAGRLHEAAEKYQEGLLISPEHPWALFNLGIIAQGRGLPDQARIFYSRAIAAKPDFSEAYYNLGNVYKNLGNFSDARKFYEYAIRCKNDFYEAYNNLGAVLNEMGMGEQAIQAYEAALRIRPAAEIYNNIGLILHSKGFADQAFKYYHAALQIDPNHIPTLNSLGPLYYQQEQYEEAQRIYNHILGINPNDQNAIGNECNLLMSTSRVSLAIEKYRGLISRDPNNITAYNNLLLSMIYDPSITPEELSQTACEFGRKIADPLLRQRILNVDKNPDRKLRIGYVSPDFRTHPVSSFFGSLLKNRNRDRFEIFAYYNNDIYDQETKKIQDNVDYWRNIKLKSDDEAADIIEADRIDILIDLAGHTARNRLLVFARKPAPIQASWLGYPATTGMKAMDYRITDSYAEPQGLTEHLNIEKLWRLPQIFCCYSDPGQNINVTDHAPFEDNGYITFGCFNNFSKVSDNVLQTWAMILERVPDSRLLLEIAGLQSPAYKSEIEGRIRKSGLPLERVILEIRQKKNRFALYNKIDIALDPFPCTGGTTSIDTLWMGVPFITLAGRHFASRMGVTILANAGLSEFISKDTNEYISKAITLATDPKELKNIRHKLQQKIMVSPLMDQKLFVKNMEDAYIAMWREYCASQATDE